MYLVAPNAIRRQLNQGIFSKIFLDEDGEVERVELTEAFAALLDHGLVERVEQEQAERERVRDP